MISYGVFVGVNRCRVAHVVTRFTLLLSIVIVKKDCGLFCLSGSVVTDMFPFPFSSITWNPERWPGLLIWKFVSRLKRSNCIYLYSGFCVFFFLSWGCRLSRRGSCWCWWGCCSSSSRSLTGLSKLTTKQNLFSLFNFLKLLSHIVLNLTLNYLKHFLNDLAASFFVVISDLSWRQN